MQEPGSSSPAPSAAVARRSPAPNSRPGAAPGRPLLCPRLGSASVPGPAPRPPRSRERRLEGERPKEPERRPPSAPGTMVLDKEDGRWDRGAGPAAPARVPRRRAGRHGRRDGGRQRGRGSCPAPRHGAAARPVPHRSAHKGGPGTAGTAAPPHPQVALRGGRAGRAARRGHGRGWPRPRCVLRPAGEGLTPQPGHRAAISARGRGAGSRRASSAGSRGRGCPIAAPRSRSGQSGPACWCKWPQNGPVSGWRRLRLGKVDARLKRQVGDALPRCFLFFPSPLSFPFPFSFDLEFLPQNGENLPAATPPSGTGHEEQPRAGLCERPCGRGPKR